MKSPRRRGALLGLAIVLVAVVFAGWLALTGRVDWLARFAKPRIVGALHDAKVETEDLDIASLSLEGGRVGHAKATFKGGSVEVHGLDVSLGMGRIRARRAGAIHIDRLDMKLDPGLLEAAQSSNASSEGVELPFDSLDVKEWHLEWILNEVPITASGTLKAEPGADGVVAISGDIAVDKATGSFSGTYSNNAGKLQMKVDAAQIPPEVVLAILRAFPKAADLGGVTFGWETAKGTAQFTIAKGAQATAHGEVAFANFVVAHEDQNTSIGTATVTVDWKEGESPLVDLEAGAVKAAYAGNKLDAKTLQFVGNEEGGSVSIGNVVATMEGGEVRGHALATVSRDASGAFSSEGTVILDSAQFDELKAGQSEIGFAWKEGVLSAHTDSLSLSGVVEAGLSGVQLQIAGFIGEIPSLSGAATVTLDPAAFVKEGVAVPSGRETIDTKFSGLLGKGNQSVRVEFALPSRERSLEVDGTKLRATGALEGVVTIDPNHFSGSASGEWKNVTAGMKDGESVAFPDLKFKVSTGRVWIDELRAWADMEPRRVLRELLWVANLDLRGRGGTVDLGANGKAGGVAATIVSNGADISEHAGGSLVFSARTLGYGSYAFADLGGSLNFGLDGGTLVADVAMAQPRISIHLQEAASWRDGLSISGRDAIPDVDLGKAGSWGGLFDALKGVTAAGHISASGNLGIDSNGFAADSHVDLASVSAEWPDKKAVLGGLSGMVDLQSVIPLRARPGQKITVGSARIVNLDLSDGVLVFGIPEPDKMAVSTLEASTLGGKVSTQPFTFDILDPKPSAKVKLDGIRLEKLMKFFPDVPATAEGAIVGEIPVAWDGSNLSFGTGYIDLRPGELGRVHFDYDIRMLTQGRDSSSMIYPVLRRVETAIRDLYFNRLRIDLYPVATPGRSAQIKIVGVTSQTDVHAPVDLDINIDAPLDRFLKWGVNPSKP